MHQYHSVFSPSNPEPPFTVCPSTNRDRRSYGYAPPNFPGVQSPASETPNLLTSPLPRSDVDKVLLSRALCHVAEAYIRFFFHRSGKGICFRKSRRGPHQRFSSAVAPAFPSHAPLSLLRKGPRTGQVQERRGFRQAARQVPSRIHGAEILSNAVLEERGARNGGRLLLSTPASPDRRLGSLFQREVVLRVRTDTRRHPSPDWVTNQD